MMLSAEAKDSHVTIAWFIPAEPESVWRALTTLLSEWLGDVTEGEISEDSTFTVAHGPADTCVSTVTNFKPATLLSYSWEFTGEPPSAVEWRLNTDSRGPILDLTHTGLVHIAQDYRDGWITHLLYLEACVLGTPLPWELFNSIHSAVAGSK